MGIQTLGNGPDGEHATPSALSEPTPLAPIESDEQYRTVMLARRQDLLPQHERTVANVEHVCRTLRGSGQACENLQKFAANACANCLRQAGVKTQDLIRSGPFKVEFDVRG